MVTKGDRKTIVSERRQTLLGIEKLSFCRLGTT